MTDMSQVIIPKSDQINADDLIAGPMTITIRDVQISGGQEQPVSIFFDGSEKAFRPCKSMSRVLVQAWGPDAKVYLGRSLTLYRDPEVKWGGLAVGGIRISHMSHIDGVKQMMLTATKGSRKPHKVLPLVVEAKDDPAEKWAGAYIAKLATFTDAAALETFAGQKAAKLAELATARAELHGRVTAALATRRAELAASFADDDDLAPASATQPDGLPQMLARIAAAPTEEAVSNLDAETEQHRAFLTDAQCDELDQALAKRRDELRTPVTEPAQ